MPKREMFDEKAIINDALRMLRLLSTPREIINDMTVRSLISIGNTLSEKKTSPEGLVLTYDHDRAIWVGKPKESTYSVDPETGDPVF